MNLRALLENIRTSGKICRSWSDRMRYLRWLYSRGSASSAQHRITFRYPPPVETITLSVRSNLGSDAFIFSEVFDHRYYDFELPQPPATILDLGANIGFTSLYFGRKYSRAALACVEPVDTNVRLLTRNLESNGINATIFNAAVGINDGFLEMNLDAHDYGHKVAGIDYGKAITGRLIKVESLSIPTLMSRLNWPKIGLLKIDIEGYEGVLLRQNCDWLRKVDALCIECHENYGEADLIALAQKFGFTPPAALPGCWLMVR
jgi:FkbM family methyltransferase